jgi:DNA-binding IclR family transcriptional regulator
MSSAATQDVEADAKMPAAAREQRDAAGGSQTLERGLRLLALLAERPGGLTVSEISIEMATHRAGIYRLLRPLEAVQLVERRAEGTYMLGLGLVSLAANVRSRLQEVAAQELRRLADHLACTCALTVRSGEEGIVTLVQEPLVARMHIAYRPGLHHPLTQAAPGLAILAGDRPHSGERKEIVEARKKGYAVSHGELFAGATGIAVPILGDDGVSVASISAVWLGDQLDIEPAATELLRSAEAITATLTEEARSGLVEPIALR